MKISIGGRDYTFALDAVHPLSIERKLNEPSVCRFWLTLPSNSAGAVSRNQSVRIDGDDETCYFTGYISATPMPEYAGLGMEGPRYRFSVEAFSDESLLDQLSMSPVTEAAGTGVNALIASLAAKTGSNALSTQSLSINDPVANFRTRPGERFSSAAGRAAKETRSAYRAFGGALQLISVPAAVHVLDESSGTVTPENLTLTAGTRRALANDITVCGEHEPTEYVSEYFLGDGLTSQFNLSADAFAPPASRQVLIREQFEKGQIDCRLWGNTGSGGYLKAGAGGLVMEGGTGRDGDTQLAWLDPIEMGGTLLLEASGVGLQNGSSGILAGFFAGEQTQQACIAGFQVTAQQGSGAVSVQPLISGSPAGTVYQINSWNQYAMRVRIHCSECERILPIYRGYGDSGATIAGGQLNAAPAQLHLEIQEFVNGVAGMPVTLYEGLVTKLPVTGSVLAASSINLYGSIRAIRLTNLGSAWVLTAADNGSPVTRRIGTAAESAECQIEGGNKLVFLPGFTPRAGERIVVNYRALGRSVGRSLNEASQKALAQAGLPAVSAWIGTVTDPPPRSSQDCRNAANVLQQAAASEGALWAGTYTCNRAGLDSDLWPGDALQFNVPSANLNAQVVVRAVKMTYRASLPDVVQYTIAFANDWADDLAIRTSETVPADAWLPAAIGPTYATNLSGLTVTGITGANVTIDAGTPAPSGGGFEIRRRDNCFMPGTDTDLVMRSSQPTMTFQRVSASDRFYIRMYDGADPPNYSEFSAALIFNLPLAS